MSSTLVRYKLSFSRAGVWEHSPAVLVGAAEEGSGQPAGQASRAQGCVVIVMKLVGSLVPSRKGNCCGKLLSSSGNGSGGIAAKMV